MGGKLLRGIALSLAASGVFVLSARAQPSAESSPIHLIRLDDRSINPVTAEYILQAVDRAAAGGAACLVLQLDTPGGLLSSTHSIVKKLLASPIPVVVYVSPKGARAGSAGVFISYAAHVLAMAPSTHIGAAHPVQMGEPRQRDSGWKRLLERFLPEEEEKEKSRPKPKRKERGSSPAQADPMSEKILQDTAAFIRAIAQERGRDPKWGVRFVVESRSLTAEEAMKEKVIDLLAEDEAALWGKLDGRVVTVGGQARTLRTQGVAVQTFPMDFRQQVLDVLANPNIAYLLMMLGFYGLLFEVTHPGFGVPGVLGILFILLAFFGMQMLPINATGLLLLILGVVLFAVEVMSPGIGLLTLGGLVSMILGSFLLFDSPVELVRVSGSLVFIFSAATAVITLGLVRAALRAGRLKSRGGAEGLVGETAWVRTALMPGKEGKVFVHGELWNAASEEPIPAGERVRILKAGGMTLQVQKISQERER